ncbi:hypothetical protein HPB48_003160 [Haemaphysalis longicornis]|uniref:Mucin core protein n=1 Tax=Haemaphysalis longicornis TaxID=44386 RepID=A0A9J6H393_HAELO|nr:hypothetical protein HPB48_003160 [Haemaphysalis longicornis]
MAKACLLTQRHCTVVAAVPITPAALAARMRSCGRTVLSGLAALRKSIRSVACDVRKTSASPTVPVTNIAANIGFYSRIIPPRFPSDADNEASSCSSAVVRAVGRGTLRRPHWHNNQQFFYHRQPFSHNYDHPNTTTAAPQPSTMSPQPQTTTVHPNTTTPVPSTTHLPTTAVPPTSAPPEERHFDTLSFLGGIILTLGGLAIFYVGFKFYKARTERNYHTL